MRAMKRAVHIDFHTMPGIYDFNREWDAAEFAQTLKDANVAYINATARCNIGFSYFKTKIGIPYPGMKGDMFGDLLKECHKRDIGVSAYMNAGLDHEHAARHMDWLRLDKDGHVIKGDLTGNFFRMLCYNNPDYQSYHFGVLKEICAYDVDGVFLDCMAIQPCFCYHCITKMREQGIDPYEISENMKFQKKSMLEFSEKSREIAGNNRYLFLNGMHYKAVEHLNTHIEVECLPSGWSYDFYWPHVTYARNINPNVLYMTGRFQINWGDFGGFKTQESLEYDYYDALSAGVGVSVGDHMHPVRNLNKDIYRVIGQMNAFVKQLEPYTEKAKPLSDIGVLINAEQSLDLNGTDMVAGTDMSESYSGLSRMLGELNQSYEIINECMDFARFRLLILPDSIKMNETLKVKLKRFLNQGGKILSTGTAGLNEENTDFVYENSGLSFCGIDDSNASYFKFVQSQDAKIFDMEYGTYSDTGVLMKADNKLAVYVRSYFNKHWDGIHSYFYTPPEKVTEYAAAAMSKDNAICHICFGIFKAYHIGAAYFHKALVRDCLNKLMPNPLIKTCDIPSTARVTATGCDEYILLHVKVSHPEPRGKMDIIEEHSVLQKGATILIRGRYDEVRTLPDKIKLETKYNDHYTEITLPEIVGYKMIYAVKMTD